MSGTPQKSIILDFVIIIYIYKRIYIYINGYIYISFLQGSLQGSVVQFFGHGHIMRINAKLKGTVPVLGLPLGQPSIKTTSSPTQNIFIALVISTHTEDMLVKLCTSESYS